MEKRKIMNSKINLGALALAICLFFQTTAFGFQFLFKEHNFSLTKISYKSISIKNIPIDLLPVEKEKAISLPIPNGGPDQPEVQSFTPIGTSDMVDPFTGDFSYNIPLLDIDGYPINIAYNAGVQMDQEASWVGLGWNLNPGTVNRTMRGLPDDFNGTDTIEKAMNLADNWTVGGSIGADYELFGFGEPSGNDEDTTTNLGLNVNASLGIQYNNYTGFSSNVSFGIGAEFGSNGGNKYGKYSAGLGFSGSSTGGATISPSLGLNLTGTKTTPKGKINLASPINSRYGYQQISVSYTRMKEESKSVKRKNGQSINYVDKNRLPISSSYNFGMSTFTPQISMPMNTGGGTFSFKLGPDIFANDFSATLSGFYTKQWLKERFQSVPAYGYMNLQSGQKNSDAMMDFNRENDGPFTKNTPALPVPSITYDIFSVSGQGVSGSYRPVRKDIGYVFDPTVKNNSVNGSLGLEVNLGGTFKGGVDIALTYANSQSGAWNGNGNQMAGIMEYNRSDFYFREANELAVDADPSHFNDIGGSTPVRFDVTSYRKIKTNLKTTNNDTVSSLNSYTKTGEDRRNQVVYTLNNAELKKGIGNQILHSEAHAWTSDQYDHHIGQFTVLNTEGSRYVYGIAAYSHFQKNVSFAVGSTKENPYSGLLPDCVTKRITYLPGDDNSLENERGVDNYYNSVTTPDFAHSYLLTTILNADYVDADIIKGPSKGDLGGYLTFDYKKINGFKWRNPINENEASFDEGMNTDRYDDKAHYIYGEKELWYVTEIRSKNHIAIFYTSDRNDGYAVNDENGGIIPSNATMQKLDSIRLFALPDYEADAINAVPLKIVHFEYDYSLCPDYDQNIIADIRGTGKLTLTKIYFTYQGSNKGRYSPYTFEYGYNPSYEIKNVDRWNCYKPTENCTGNIATDPLKPTDFPYVGFDQVAVDKWSSAWNVNVINLPSGGRIEVDYESDDYAYVQHKKAANMLKIIAVHGVNKNDPNDMYLSGDAALNDDTNTNPYIYVEIVDGNLNVEDYVKAGDLIYFRALMKFGQGKYDFVPGYATVGSSVPPTIVTLLNGQQAIRIGFEGAKLKDNGNSVYHPIAVAGIQFGRIYLSSFIPPSANVGVDENANLPDLAESIGGAFESMGEFFTGPNKPLWNQGVGTSLVIDHSWVRFENPNNKKLGGGCRVKEIRMYDAWDVMTSGEMENFYYGQQYEYTLPDGTSSGVAAYEPQVGNDENLWRQPVVNDKRVLLAPDVRNYQETPFGEQFFPSPRVGYSVVTIRDLPREGVSRTATGKVVHEFYTAKDFPSITDRTSVKYKRLKIPVFAFFFSSMIDEMAASQGFVVENNDMHGKPKRQTVYPEGQTDPITKVEYFYQSEPIVIDGVSAYHLTNEVTTIDNTGSVGQSTIGLTYEAVADFRKSTSNTISGSIDFNLNNIFPFVILPTVMGTGSYERTAFRSATFTKVIERFGLQTKTVATDLGSKVETNNLAYDAVTGIVLLTQTTTDFNDAVYNFTYPAHWYYEQMGQAYKNVGKTIGQLQFVNGGVGLTNNYLFVKGDEIDITHMDYSHELGWVVDASPSGIKVLLKNGTPLNGTIKKIKILRSGRRNLQTTPIGTIALRANPLNQISGNVFDKILQAGAVEYSDDWRTFCECFLDEEAKNYTTNPYVLGTRGTWRPKASYVHLSGRTQTYDNGNSNIRQDGVFTSFNPFYKIENGNWKIDRQNWTYTSSVTEFSPFGQALETIDALDRYSSSMFGYNQTLPIAVAANTRYRQIGFDGFEDYAYDNCSDNHFKLGQGAEIVSNQAHTGRNSVKVTAETPLVFTSIFNEDCDESEVCMKALQTIVSGICEKGCGVQHLLLTTITPNGGVAPYQIEYEIIAGNPSVELNDGVLAISNPNGEHVCMSSNKIELFHLKFKRGFC